MDAVRDSRPPPIHHLIALVALLAPRTAHAFDFPEHRAMSLRGMAWVLTHADEASRQRLRDLVTALHGSFRPPSRVCASREEFAPSADLVARHDCFDVGDLAGLAGDHASTPESLRRRWLDGAADARVSALAGYLEGTWEASAVDEAPTVCGDERRGADAARLFTALRDLPSLTTALVSADRAYLCLAAHNAQHFRLVRLDPVAAAAEPLPNAFAAYAFYHLRAVAVATRADRAQGDARARRLAEALLVELYSQHFLEDALAGGHVASDRLALNAGSAQRTHAWHNRTGVRMTASQDLRRRADEILDTGWGASREDQSLYLGDDELLSVLDGRHCRGDDLPRCRTLAAGAALASLSFGELLDASGSGLGARLADCESTRTGHTCGSPRFIQSVLDAGHLAAIHASPRVVEWTRTLSAPTIGTLTRLRGIAGAGWRPVDGALVPTGELSLWGELLLPPFAHSDDPLQVYLGAGAHVRSEWPAAHPARGEFPRPAGARFEAGVSTRRLRIGLAVGGEVAVFGRSWVDVRPALALELDLGIRAETGDTLAWLFDLVPGVSVARFGGETQWVLGLSAGVSFERPTPRTMPCSSARRPGRAAPEITACDLDGESAYVRLRP